MGLNYESPTTCFSRLLIRVGEPIRVADYREQYERDPIGTTRDLTAEIEVRMQALLIHTENKEEERFLRRLERSVQNDAPLPVDGHHFRTQAILSALRRLREAQPAAYAELEQKTAVYDAEVRRTRVSDLGLSRNPRRRPDLWTILGLPVFLYGWLNHALAIYVPHLVWKMLNIDRGYTTTVKYGVGLITFPLFYTLQFQLAEELVPEVWAWVYLLTLPLFGFLAWRYAEHAAPFWAMVYNKVFRGGEVRRLSILRAEVLAKVPKVRVGHEMQ